MFKKSVKNMVCGMCMAAVDSVPGISGSTILLIFGLYVPVIDAVKNTMHMDFRYLPALLMEMLDYKKIRHE